MKKHKSKFYLFLWFVCFIGVVHTRHIQQQELQPKSEVTNKVDESKEQLNYIRACDGKKNLIHILTNTIKNYLI